MARVSRTKPKNIPAVLKERVYKTALYIRLSVLDSGKKDSDTVETQEALLRKYIKGKPHFMLVSAYIDNGETGVNFSRSAFERLMDDVKSGKVDCIIVKDLSRFGRNYIETGEYLEKIFPFLGVRFIAVNDGYDSFEQAASDGLSLHLKNLVNDVYARDISAKISPVLRGKQERGEFIGAWAAYGYLKSPQDKHKLIIDPETASVVRDIFAWRTEGLSYQGIARRLTEMGIPSPGRYRFLKGIVKNKCYENSRWLITTVKALLEKEVYLGHMVQGRKRESLFQGQKQAYLPRKEWIVVENTHEAIIDRQTFDTVQSLNKQRHAEYVEKLDHFSEVVNTDNILKGLVYCGDCGTKLVRYKTVRENSQIQPRLHVWYNYICPKHTSDATLCGFMSIRESILLETVHAAIQVQLAAAADMEKCLAKFTGKSAAQTEKERLEAQIRQAEDELKRTARHRESLYDDYADKLMNEHDYIFAQTRYKDKENTLQRQLVELGRSYQSICEEKAEANPWLLNFMQFQQAGELTRAMAAALIEKITIYDENRVEIGYRFEDEYQKLLHHLAASPEVSHD